MRRFSPLLFVIVMSTSLLAQRTVDWANLDDKTTIEIAAITKHCAKWRTIPTLKSLGYSPGLLLTIGNRQAGRSTTPEQLGGKQEARNQWR